MLKRYMRLRLGHLLGGVLVLLGVACGGGKAQLLEPLGDWQTPEVLYTAPDPSFYFLGPLALDAKARPFACWEAEMPYYPGHAIESSRIIGRMGSTEGWGAEQTWVADSQTSSYGIPYFDDFNGRPFAAFDETTGNGLIVTYGRRTWAPLDRPRGWSYGWVRAGRMAAEGRVDDVQVISPLDYGEVWNLQFSDNRRGTAVATWLKYYEHDAPGGARVEFQAAVHTPEGGWAPFQKLDGEAAEHYVSRPVAFVGGDGQITLLWNRSLSLWSACWIPGLGWTAPTPVNPDNSLNQGLFTLLPTPEGKLMAIWAAYSREANHWQLLAALQTPEGWAKAGVLADLKGTDQVPAAIFQRDGRLCLAYSEILQEEKQRLVVRRWNGMGLVSEEVIAEALFVGAPQLQVDASGRMLIAWQQVADRTTYRLEPWAASGDAQGWRPAQALISPEASQGGAYNLSLAVAPDGRAWAAWMSAGKIWTTQWLTR